MSEAKGQRPDWSLAIKRKGTDEKYRTVGAGWTSERGGISIRLNDDCQWEELEGCTIWLFKAKERHSGHSGEQGGYPKGHPGNVRRGESMQEYHNRRRNEVETWPSAEDYMEQQRQKRAATRKPSQHADYEPPKPENGDPAWL